MLSRLSTHRIQYASNLCISGKRLCRPSDYLVPVPDARLALLGNIGRPTPELAEFFKWCDTQFNHVDWIPGDLELSSSPHQRYDIYEKVLLLREWLVRNSIQHVQLCTRAVLPLQNPSLTLVATPMFHPRTDASHPILYQHRGKDVYPLTNQDLTLLQRQETEWLLQTIATSPSPVVCMTTTEVDWSLSRKKYTLETIPSTKLIAMFYGRTGEARLECHTEKPSPGLPWKGINMFGHKDYNRQLYMFFSKI